jgi:hypothetical protein
MKDVQRPERSEGAPARLRELAHLSLNFVLDVAGNGVSGLKTLDALLMMAVNQANIAPLTRDPAARSRYGALETPAPDAERRPVSVRAVAASLRLPYETARRNIHRLEAQGVCVVTGAGVVVPEAFMRSEPYLQAAREGHRRLHGLYQALRVADLLDPLPLSHYIEPQPPVRAAVRLMSDYLLRTADGVVGQTGELISGVVLLPLIAAAAQERPQAPLQGLTVAAIGRRLQIPVETVRRHAAALVGRGLCRKAPGGVALCDADLASPGFAGFLQDNAIAVQRMFAGLSERGVVDAWEKLAARPPGFSEGAA